MSSFWNWHILQNLQTLITPRNKISKLKFLLEKVQEKIDFFIRKKSGVTFGRKCGIVVVADEEGCFREFISDTNKAPVGNLFELFELDIERTCKKFFFMLLCICQGNLHKIKKEHLIVFFLFFLLIYMFFP